PIQYMSQVCRQRVYVAGIGLATYERARMALTDAGIKALKPRTARYMVSDGRGLSLDILPSGKMSWLYRYFLNGKYGRVSLGRYPDLTLKAARGKRDELAAQDRKST